MDPYAYWTLDRRMLNRRRGKQAAASAKLESIVGGAQVRRWHVRHQSVCGGGLQELMHVWIHGAGAPANVGSMRHI